MSKETVWRGSDPTCDICQHQEGVSGVKAVVDGKTVMGPWALMCEPHFERFGVGLGTGRGQRLKEPSPLAKARAALSTAGELDRVTQRGKHKAKEVNDG